ncbi:hypothetical protein PTKIN_Ptkin02bG0081000 [Pterospermum kingtungense]
MATVENNKHSKEETNLLECRTKKTQTTVENMETVPMEIVMESSMEIPPIGNSSVKDPVCNNPKLLFKETLLGDCRGMDCKPEEEDDFISDDEAMCEEEKEEDCPTIFLSKEEKACLRRPWRQTLIVKVMGRKMGYSYLL